MSIVTNKIEIKTIVVKKGYNLEMNCIRIESRIGSIQVGDGRESILNKDYIP